MGAIFICHSSKDKSQFVGCCANDLCDHGYEVWYDKWSLKAGQSLASIIDGGIAGCEYFFVIVSRNSLGSGWVQKELSTAIIQEIEQQKVFIMPIIIGNVDLAELPVSLRSKRCIDFRRLTEAKYEYGFSDIINTIEAFLRPQMEFAPAFKLGEQLLASGYLMAPIRVPRIHPDDVNEGSFNQWASV